MKKKCSIDNVEETIFTKKYFIYTLLDIIRLKI